MAHRLAVGVSYMYRAWGRSYPRLDENLPPPVNVQYPVYDSTGTNFLGTYLQRAVFFHLADDVVIHLSVSAVHQPSRSPDSATWRDRCISERGFERL